MVPSENSLNKPLWIFFSRLQTSEGVEAVEEIVPPEPIHEFTCDVVDFAVHARKVRDAQTQHTGLRPQVALLSAVAAVALGTEPSLRRFTIHLESPAQTQEKSCGFSVTHTLTLR